jgi:deoxyadenosine/deoxycytidine kinase
MEWDYIDELNQAYDDFFGDSHPNNASSGAPVLTIDTNNLDFVRHTQDLKAVEDRIRQALKLSPFQAELPLQLKDER